MGQEQTQQQTQQTQQSESTDSLLGKLSALLGGGRQQTTDDLDDGDGDGRRPVPYSRFQQVAAERRQLRQSLEQVGPQIEALKAQHKAELEGVKRQLADHAAQAELRRQEDVGFARAGLDEEGIETIRNAWRRQPEASRGKTAAEWWGQQVQLHKEAAGDSKKEGPKLHPTVAVLLPKVESQQPTARGQQQPTARGQQRVPSQGQQPPQGNNGRPPAGLSRKELMEWYKNKSS